MTDSLVAATDQSVEFIAQLRETEIKFSRPDFEVTLAHFHANPPRSLMPGLSLPPQFYKVKIRLLFKSSKKISGDKKKRQERKVGNARRSTLKTKALR